MRPLHAVPMSRRPRAEVIEELEERFRALTQVLYDTDVQPDAVDAQVRPFPQR